DHISELIRKYNLYPEIKSIEASVGVFQTDLKDLKTATKIRDFYPQIPESLKIVYRHRDPVKAYQVVSEITNAFSAANSSLKQEASSEAQRIGAKISDVETQLKLIGPQKDINQIRLEMLARKPSDATLIGQASTRMATEQAIENIQDEKLKIELQI